jgi:hypothetical protein
LATMQQPRPQPNRGCGRVPNQLCPEGRAGVMSLLLSRRAGVRGATVQALATVQLRSDGGDAFSCEGSVATAACGATLSTDLASDAHLGGPGSCVRRRPSPHVCEVACACRARRSRASTGVVSTRNAGSAGEIGTRADSLLETLGARQLGAASGERWNEESHAMRLPRLTVFARCQ